MPKTAAQYLSDIDIPVLDLYGDEDIPSVMQGIQEKQRASKHNSNYRQKMVNADHFFNDKDDLLVSEVNAWLK
jgi:alpha/beta superfamily hydrolase